MNRPLHTPYDGSARPFSIGLRPLDPAEWIEVDDQLVRYLAEKERLFSVDPERVFRETEESRPAQAEVLGLLAQHLPARFADIYTRRGGSMEIGPTADRVPLDDPGVPPFLSAARLVQEDLVIMQEGRDGWHLAAASLSFPSSWSLAEKFGLPMHDIHASVPEFGPGSRNAGLIQRIFDNLKPEQPVWRLNWSIYPDDALNHPAAKAERDADFLSAPTPETTFLRVEKQTLRRLPDTGAILFTIRIYVDPLAALIRHHEGAALAADLRKQLDAMTGPQLAYKGLTRRRALIIAALERVEHLAS